MPFGKYRGLPLAVLPDNYLKWLQSLTDLRQPLRRLIDAEVRARETERGSIPTTQLAPGVQAVAISIVGAGFRAMARTLHPDVGGDHGTMIELTQARDALVALLRRVGG